MVERITRQQRRAMQRQMQGMTPEQAERMIVAYRKAEEAKREEARKLAPGIVDDVMEKIRKELEPQIRQTARDQTKAEMLILIMAYEHIDRGHTGKYLGKWIRGLLEFCDAVMREGSGIEGLRKILEEECGIVLEDVLDQKGA